MVRSFLARKFGPKTERRLVSLCLINSENDSELDKWIQNAVHHLVRKLKKHPRLIDELEKAISQKCPETKCISIPKTLDKRLLISHRRGLPQVIYCRLWRWPDLQSHHQIKAIHTCESSPEYNSGGVEQPNRSQTVCINPYHYERTKPSPIDSILIPRIPPDLSTSFEDSDTTGGGGGGGTKARPSDFVFPQISTTSRRQFVRTTVTAAAAVANLTTAIPNLTTAIPGPSGSVGDDNLLERQQHIINSLNCQKIESSSSEMSKTPAGPDYVISPEKKLKTQSDHESHLSPTLAPQAGPSTSQGGSTQPYIAGIFHPSPSPVQGRYQQQLHHHHHPRHQQRRVRQQHLRSPPYQRASQVHQQQQRRSPPFQQSPHHSQSPPFQLSPHPIQQQSPPFQSSPHQVEQHQIQRSPPFQLSPQQIIQQQQQPQQQSPPFQQATQLIQQPQQSPIYQQAQQQQQPYEPFISQTPIHQHHQSPQQPPQQDPQLQALPQVQSQTHYQYHQQHPEYQQQYYDQPYQYQYHQHEQQQVQYTTATTQQHYEQLPIQEPTQVYETTSPGQQSSYSQMHDQSYIQQAQIQPQSGHHILQQQPQHYHHQQGQYQTHMPDQPQQQYMQTTQQQQHYPQLNPRTGYGQEYVVSTEVARPFRFKQNRFSNVARARQQQGAASGRYPGYNPQVFPSPQPQPADVKVSYRQPYVQQQQQPTTSAQQTSSPPQQIVQSQLQHVSPDTAFVTTSTATEPLSYGVQVDTGPVYTTMYAPQQQFQQTEQMQLDYQADPDSVVIATHNSPTLSHYEPVVGLNQDLLMEHEVAIDIQEVPYAEGTYWCSISYFEYDQKMGEKYQSNHRVVSVDGYTQPACLDRFCIGGISNVNRNQFTEWVRRRIGRGARLTYVDGEVYVEGLSDSSIFVSSPLQSAIQGDMVIDHVSKLTNGCTVKVFSTQAFSKLLANAVSRGFEEVYKLTNCCIVRVSFVKGWGRNYKRQSIYNTPCWVEVQLNGPLQWIDKVLRQMRPPTGCGSTS